MKRQDRADVLVLEFNRSLGAVNQSPKALVVLGLVVGNSREFLLEHEKVVGDRRLHFVAGPRVLWHQSSAMCCRHRHLTVDVSDLAAPMACAPNAESARHQAL